MGRRGGGGPVGAGEEGRDEGLHGARAVGIGEEVEEVPVGQEEVPRERHPLLVQHLRSGGGVEACAGTGENTGVLLS